MGKPILLDLDSDEVVILATSLQEYIQREQWAASENAEQCQMELANQRLKYAESAAQLAERIVKQWQSGTESPTIDLPRSTPNSNNASKRLLPTTRMRGTESNEHGQN